MDQERAGIRPSSAPVTPSCKGGEGAGPRAQKGVGERGKSRIRERRRELCDRPLPQGHHTFTPRTGLPLANQVSGGTSHTLNDEKKANKKNRHRKPGRRMGGS